ncbi:MAG: YkgJ family cysteine cluster protein [Geobacter sp.]|nr:YkgJ family cysteine cluster protein [Geobacter sp.]
MTELLERYGSLLREVDAWFQACSKLYPDQIRCQSGCSSCCRGLFDITLLDAFYLKYGFDQLSIFQQTDITADASRRLNALSAQFPAFVEPWVLNVIPEDEWEELMPEEDETPCLLLSESGECLLYEHRPMTCRLNGIPLIDRSGEELFDEWCTLNFTEKDPLLLDGLRFEFLELFAQELLMFQELIVKLAGARLSELDLFIPAAIVLDRDKVVSVVKALIDKDKKS